jgi:pyruvate/2-oxoglutarate dehydrogenase complex dihydrolipoamide dehydrogenase (E3) component
VLEEPSLVHGHVVVFDDEGGITGGSVAQLLQTRGVQVTLVTRYAVVAPRHDNTRQNRVLRAQLESAGVVIRTSAGLERICQGSVVLRNELTYQQEAVQEVSGVVIVAGRHSRAPVSGDVDSLAEDVYVVGDALSPRSMVEATYEGHRAGRAA